MVPDNKFGIFWLFSIVSFKFSMFLYLFTWHTLKIATQTNLQKYFSKWTLQAERKYKQKFQLLSNLWRTEKIMKMLFKLKVQSRAKNMRKLLKLRKSCNHKQSNNKIYYEQLQYKCLEQLPTKTYDLRKLWNLGERKRNTQTAA